MFERREIPHRHQRKPKHRLIAYSPPHDDESGKAVELEEGSMNGGDRTQLSPRNIPIQTRTVTVNEDRLPTIMRPNIQNFR